MWLWMICSAIAGGCRPTIGHALSAWEEIAVAIPAGGATVPAVSTALDAVTAHTAIARALREAKTRRGRDGTAAAVARALAWLDANPASLGVDDARTALAAVDAACPSAVEAAPVSAPVP